MMMSERDGSVPTREQVANVAVLKWPVIDAVGMCTLLIV